MASPQPETSTQRPARGGRHFLPSFQNHKSISLALGRGWGREPRRVSSQMSHSRLDPLFIRGVLPLRMWPHSPGRGQDLPWAAQPGRSPPADESGPGRSRSPRAWLFPLTARQLCPLCRGNVESPAGGRLRGQTSTVSNPEGCVAYTTFLESDRPPRPESQGALCYEQEPRTREQPGCGFGQPQAQSGPVGRTGA